MSQNALIYSGETDYNLGKVAQVPIPKVEKDKLLVKSIAYAANPTDWKHVIFKLGGIDVIMGSDTAGIVEEVGSDVKGFEKGDYVSVFQRGGYYKDAGGFSDYILASTNTTIKYPKDQIKDTVLPVGVHESSNINTWESAASVTLGLSTVALSFAHTLKLKKGTNDSILIWGGATATGVLAIQIAKLVYGLKVIATASKKNHEFLKSLGADAVFDYNDSDVVSQIIDYGKGSIKYGLDTVADAGTFQNLYDATANSGETWLDNLLGVQLAQIKTDSSRTVHSGGTLAYVAIGLDVDFLGTVFKSSPELVADYLEFWNNDLPPLIPKLKTSNLKVLKAGLESANEALHLLRENKVSAEKLVWRA